MTATMMVPVLCRNRTTGPLVLASDYHSTHEVIFSGKDSPDGKDIQPIPEELLRTPQFARAVSMGLLEVEEGKDHEAVRAALSRQTDAYQQRASRDRQESLMAMESPAKDDLVAQDCIGPGSRPGASCEEQVPVYASKINSSPPLCSRHSHLADHCVRRGNGPYVFENPLPGE